MGRTALQHVFSKWHYDLCRTHTHMLLHHQKTILMGFSFLSSIQNINSNLSFDRVVGHFCVLCIQFCGLRIWSSPLSVCSVFLCQQQPDLNKLILLYISVIFASEIYLAISHILRSFIKRIYMKNVILVHCLRQTMKYLHYVLLLFVVLGIGFVPSLAHSPWLLLLHATSFTFILHSSQIIKRMFIKSVCALYGK